MRRVKENDNPFDTIRYHEFCIERLEKRICELEKKAALERRERERKKKKCIRICNEIARVLEKALHQ